MINIPFLPDFEIDMMIGRKTATTRTKKYGKQGDQFISCGILYELTDDVTILTLDEVAHSWYTEEGFATPEQFIVCWIKLHPRKGYIPKQKVFLHQFKVVEAIEGLE
jgi:hypothetical protein